MGNLDTRSSEKNEVEESKYRFLSQVIICVFERSGFPFHDGCECRLNPADVAPRISIRAVDLRKIPKSKHKKQAQKRAKSILSREEQSGIWIITQVL